MHELSIASSLVEQVEQAAREHQFTKVNQVRLAIGEWSGIEPEALQFCFPEVSKNTCLSQAKLVIELKPLKALCLDCQTESVFKMHDHLVCQSCGRANLKDLEGKELQILDLDVD